MLFDTSVIIKECRRVLINGFPPTTLGLHELSCGGQEICFSKKK